jgi:hypothetical protein
VKGYCVSKTYTLRERHTQQAVRVKHKNTEQNLTQVKRGSLTIKNKICANIDNKSQSSLRSRGLPYLSPPPPSAQRALHTRAFFSDAPSVWAILDERHQSWRDS